MINIKNYRQKEITLKFHQIKLRDMIQNKKYFISDGKVTFRDLSAALGDTLHPINTVNQKETNGKLLVSELYYKEINIPVKGVLDVFSKTLHYLFKKGYILLNACINGQDYIMSFSYNKRIRSNNVLEYLFFGAFITFFAAISNLLPIPMLDGGVLLILLIEKVTGKSVNRNTQKAIAKIFWIFIILFMIIIIFNGIASIIISRI